MRLAAVALATLAATGAAQGSAARAVPASARALAGRLRGGHRAEATLAYTLVDPLGGPARQIRGRIALEPPDRLRVDFSTTGESVALRTQGGEWLQPANRQLVRIPPDRAGAALSWGRALLPSSGSAFREDSLGPRRFRLMPLEPEGGPVSVQVELDAHGLPSRLTVEQPDSSGITYHFSSWRFMPARGSGAYTITPPPGFEVVDLP